MCCAVHAGYIQSESGTCKYDNDTAVVKKNTWGHFVEVILC